MTFSYKRFLRLSKPDREDFRPDRERILDALKPLDVSMSLDAMRALSPMTAEADYAVTVTLCPGPQGMEVIRVEPGDTTGRLLGLALDIGTNGELCLGCKDCLLMGAGAAGPALEGFGSRYGMRAEPGAIRHLRMGEDGVFRLDVIGGGEPKGICGTGIFDLVAECYRYGIINGDGTVNMDKIQYVAWVWDENTQESLPAVVYGRNGEETLHFTQRNIQEFVRCKAAGFTMVATLLDYCGLRLSDIDKFYLAGGFGTHIDLESAITVGLYPDVNRRKLVPLGNTSLQGAKKLLLDTACLERLDWFRRNGIYLHFSEMETFPQSMVAANFIPHTDGSLYPSVKRHPLGK